MTEDEARNRLNRIIHEWTDADQLDAILATGPALEALGYVRRELFDKALEDLRLTGEFLSRVRTVLRTLVLYRQGQASIATIDITLAALEELDV